MTWLLTRVQWEILATVGLAVLAFAGLMAWCTWQGVKALFRALLT